MGVQV